ncbi:MAG: 30S ribosomal protein S4, partial [Chloroflexota bacterium]
HGHILVDGKKLDLPSYSVLPGQVISVREPMRKNVHVLDAMEGVAYNLSYLQVDKNAFAAHFTNLPERTEIPVPIDEQLIVEFYTRLV